MPNYTVTRTFHPVGQGAFYTEQFYYDNQLFFTVAYDCGCAAIANVKGKSSLLDEIDNLKGKINVLFLSHLHDDHVNGLKYLLDNEKIDHVIFPELTDDEILLSVIHNYLMYKSTTIVGGTISKIRKRVNHNNNGEIDIENTNTLDQGVSVPKSGDILPDSSLEHVFDLEKGNYSKIPKDSIFILRDIWEYIPYNPPTNNIAQLAKDIRQLLNVSGNITQSIHDQIIQELAGDEKLLKDVRKCYQEYHKNQDNDKNINHFSMPVYSGPLIPISKVNFNYNLWQAQFNSVFRTLAYQESAAYCLYLGDLNMKNQSTQGRVYSFYSYRWKNVGIIQIPHHGANRDFDISLLANKPISVISYGTKNIYGHPAPNVLSQITGSNCIPVIVNEWDITDCSITIDL